MGVEQERLALARLEGAGYVLRDDKSWGLPHPLHAVQDEEREAVETLQRAGFGKITTQMSGHAVGRGGTPRDVAQS